MTRTTASDIDRRLTDESYFADPYPVLSLLRDTAPVFWSEALGAWLVSRHDLVTAVLRDAERFSSFGWELRYLERLPAEVRARIPGLLAHHRTPNIITADPPLHTRLRRSVMRGFTPRAVEPLRQVARERTDQLLASARASGHLEVMAEVASPLPASIIGDLMGVPAGDRDRFMAWSQSQTRFFGTARPDAALAARTESDLGDFRSYLSDLMVQRRREPQSDIVSVLLAPDDDGARLTDEEILATLVIFLVAGHETTRNLIGNGLLALLRDPDQLAALRADDGLMPQAIEEMLRFDPPVQRVRRRATRDTELDGVTLRAGDTVMVLIAAANRDPHAFDDPDRFDVHRRTSGHAAFGGGIHYCLGAGLARIEAPIAIGAILALSPHLGMAPGWTPRWARSMTLRGLSDLRLVLEP